MLIIYVNFVYYASSATDFDIKDKAGIPSLEVSVPVPPGL